MRQIVGAYRLQLGTLIRRGQQLAAHFHQAIAIGAAAGHQFEGEAIALPQTINRRRGHGEQGGVANAAELFGGAQGDGLSGIFFAFTFGPVFQRHEGHPGVLSAAAKAKAVDGKDHVCIGFLFRQEPVGDLAANFGGTYRRRPGGQRVLDHDFALILRRQEAARQFPHRQRHAAANQDKSAHHHCRAAQAADNTMLIALLGASPQTVKGAEEAFGMRFRMAQQRAAQRRG